VDTIFRLCAEGLVGLSQDDVRAVAHEVWEKEQKNLFPFVPQLVELLRSRGYHPLLLTGSPLEIAEPVAEGLEIKNRWGSVFETEADRYTGRIARSLRSSEEKRRITLAFAEGKSIEWDHSFAIGDSESDYEVLRMVGKPVVFEPDASLASLPHGRGWHHANRHDLADMLADIL
jgi:phosphoserine phosphatase